jgi:hypothetical protein
MSKRWQSAETSAQSSARIVPQHEVPWPYVVPRDRRVPASTERFDRGRRVALLDGDVEVGVATGLGAEARVHRPSAVDPDADPCAVHQRQDAADVLRGHLGLLGGHGAGGR